MESKQRKNTTRRMLTLTSRHDRFIASYLKAKHPQVYDEADEFYMQLNQMYPEKRDLRKTVEFLHATTGITNFSEFYYKNKISKRVEKKHITDNMLLEIPLLGQGTVTNNENEEENTHANESHEEENTHANESHEEENTHVNESHEEENTHANESPSPLVIPEQLNTHVSESHLVLSDQVYEDLVRDLMKDPDLRAIFKDFDDVDISQEDQPVSSDQIKPQNMKFELENLIQELCQDPDLNMDEPTPLEWELYSSGY